ncbi:MAG: hypothetical protein ACK4S0_01625 [Sediminibacterium sp.]
MKILVKANIDGEVIRCTGTIDIHWKNEHQVYVSWTIFSPATTIVSKSENFKYKGTIESSTELINKIIERILKYRLGRKKIFEEVAIFEK